MLSGVKFIARDEISNDKARETKKKKEKRRRRSSKYDDSKSNSSSDDIEMIQKSSKKKNKKWYNSEEDDSQSTSTDDNNKKKRKKKQNKSRSKELLDDGKETNVEITRKEMGLDWMLRPMDNMERKAAAVVVDNRPVETPVAEEMERVNPRELNPYLKDNGSGYPDDADEKKSNGVQLLSSSLVGDGGASWRLKALKRAREQATREGRNLEEVVEERWGSLGQLAVSAASSRAAPSRAHLHAIRNRQRGPTDEVRTSADDESEREAGKTADRSYLKDVSVRHPEMRAPKFPDSLSWGRQKTQNRSNEDAGLISDVVSSLNKFANDGSFMNKVLGQQNNDLGSSVGSQMVQEGNAESKFASSEMSKSGEGSRIIKEALSANQLAAKALQLRMKGKHEEAEKLMQEAESMKEKQGAGQNSSRPQGSTSRYARQDVYSRKKEDDADRHLAQKIIQNKQYNLAGRADDEYDFEDGPSRKSRKKQEGSDKKIAGKNNIAKRVLTQQERCLFCFENPNRPKHLVVSIANFSYLMLPQSQPVVPGHCCILPLQHESATRNVDNNVWEEIRNFKKCLIMMFAKQDKDLVFLETVMGLAQQRRHCLIECIPLPQEIAKGAPLYFKKAIDEAEDEWSQHNAKKLIDTSEKGLRGSIPKDFPYFHVEFGLNKGFVHVIDDESQFKSSFGLNVIRGMLRLPEEDMYRRRRNESLEMQKQAIASFAQDWEAFDWTKQLD